MGEVVGRAFTVSAVWGLLIVRGVKDVENRSFRVPDGARYLVHCSRRMLWRDWDGARGWIRGRFGESVEVPEFGECLSVAGMVIGQVAVREALLRSESRWWDGVRVAWHLEGAVRFDPVAARGNLGVWPVGAGLMERCREARRRWVEREMVGGVAVKTAEGAEGGRMDAERRG